MSTPPPAVSESRPFYWSVRRELWENRSIWIAPLTVAAIVQFGTMIAAFMLPHHLRAAAAQGAAKQHELVAMPYHVVPGLVAVTAFLVGVFYCLDALHGERRDRSILFWKSLPVSDRTTVLAKASIPLVVLPVIVFAIVIVSHLIMLVHGSAVLAMSGVGADVLWSRLPLIQLWLAVLYALVAMALWLAPVYGWLLLVSAWAKRATLMWATLPFLAIVVFEAAAFRTHNFAMFLGYRLGGWFTQAFTVHPHGLAPHDPNPLSALTPGHFLSTPGLWIGLVFAAGFLAATVWVRRSRDPI